MIVGCRAAKREVLMWSVVVGIDIVEDEDDDTSDEVVEDKEVAFSKDSGDLEWSCWTSREGVVGGTCDGLKWPCRLHVELWRRYFKLARKNPTA